MIRNTTKTDRVVKKKNRISTIYIAIIVVLILVVTGLFSLTKSSIGSWMKADRTVSNEHIRMSTATKSRFEKTISVQGKIVASIRPSIFSLSDGAVSLKVQSGDLVKEGDIIVTIDNPNLINSHQQELSNAEQTQNSLERLKILTKQTKLASKQELISLEIVLNSAKRRMVRMNESYANNAVSKEKYETAQDELDLAKLNFKHANERINLDYTKLDFELESKIFDVKKQQLVVENLQRQVDELNVTSPVDGVVGNVVVEEKDKITRNQILMTVINLTAYEIHIEIPENYADDLAIGHIGTITYQNSKLEGTLSSISPEVTSGYIKARVSIDKKNNVDLKQNQRVMVKLLLEFKDDAITIKRGPFLNEGAGRVIYVVKDGLAVRRAIKIGGIGVNEVEVLEGLSPGEKVIISSTSTFADADKVLLK